MLERSSSTCRADRGPPVNGRTRAQAGGQARDRCTSRYRRSLHDRGRSVVGNLAYSGSTPARSRPARTCTKHEGRRGGRRSCRCSQPSRGDRVGQSGDIARGRLKNTPPATRFRSGRQIGLESITSRAGIELAVEPRRRPPGQEGNRLTLAAEDPTFRCTPTGSSQTACGQGELHPRCSSTGCWQSR